jgi:hypothetical protein
MAAIRATLGLALDRSVHDSFAQLRAMSRQTSEAIARDAMLRRGGGGASANPELIAARAAHAEQSRLNREILRQQSAAQRQQDTEARRLARQRTREELSAIRERQREERAAIRERERDERRSASAAMSLNRQRSAAMWREYTAREREIDRLATRSSHRATRFMFPRPEGAIGFAQRTANDVLRGVGVDLSLGSSITRAKERESAGMGLAQQERIATGKTRGGAYWSGISESVGIDLKIAPEKVTEMMRAFTGKTGDFDAAAKSAQELASMTLASGANMGDMGSAAGYVYNQLKGMPDAAERTLDVMRGIVGQTAVGAVEMEEYAKQMGRIAANAKMFQGDVSKNILELSALTQLSIAEGGATSGADAARSIAAFANTTSKGQRINAFKEYGINLFNKAGTQKRPILDIIKDSLMASKGNIPAMTKMWADTLGQKPIRGLTNAFNEAGGGEKGWQAALEKIKPFMNVQMDKDTERSNVADYQKTTTAKAQNFQNRFDQLGARVLQKLLPALEKLEEPTLKVAENLANFVAWVPDNLGKTIALMAGYSISRALSESLFRALMEKAINSSFGRNAAGTWNVGSNANGFVSRRNSAGSLTSVGGTMGAIGTGLGIGAGVATGLYVAGTQQYSSGVAKTDEISKTLVNAHGAELGAAIVEAETKREQYRKDQGVFGGALNSVMNLFGAGDSAEMKGLSELLLQKKLEFAQWQNAGGKMSPEAQQDLEAQKLVSGWRKEKELDPTALGRGVAEAMKGQIMQVRVTNAGDIGMNKGGGGPEVDDSGRATNGKKR